MTEPNNLIERAIQDVRVRPLRLEDVYRRQARDHRRRRVASASVASLIMLAVAAAAVSLARTDTVPANQTPLPPMRQHDEVLVPAKDGQGLDAIEPATGDVRLVVDCADACAGGISNAAWSPDSTRVAYVVSCVVRSKFDTSACTHPESAAAGLFVADANGTHEVVGFAGQQETSQFDWSPDGQALAYAWWGEDPGLYVADPNGAGATLVDGTQGIQATGPVWSPDGQTIAFDTRDGVDTAPAQGGQVTQVAVGASGVGWSPDGAHLAYTSSGSTFVSAPDGSDPRKIGDGYVFAWSPDGQNIAVQIEQRATGGFSERISVVSMRAFAERTVLASSCCEALIDDTLAWSPDGTRLAFLTYSHGPGPWRMVPADAASPAVSIGDLPRITAYEALSWQSCLCANENVPPVP